MTRLTFLLRGLVHFRRSHLAVLGGTAVTCGILTGALLVGSSVRRSLVRIVELRLGRVAVAVSSGERLFDVGLGGQLAGRLARDTTVVLGLTGSASEPESARRLNSVHVWGIEPAFWTFGPAVGGRTEPAAGEAVLNVRAAQRLDVGPGDTVVLRVPQVDAMPTDAPLARVEAQGRALRLTVRSVIGEDEFGRFSLRAEQTSPYNVFVSRRFLCDRLGIPEQGNLLLVSGEGEGAPSASRVSAALAECDLAGVSGLRFDELPSGSVELRSNRIFLDEAVESAALPASPGAERILTYFVNSLSRGDLSTPYSFVTGTDGGWLPAGLGDDEIVINEWLARDLDAAAGDAITLTYFVVGGMRRLEERSSVLRVHSVIPLSGRAADPSLMPDFPGLSGADSCTDWEPGIPIDLDRIRDRDEAYWDTHGGTPKAFVGLGTAQRLWSNRFGGLTSIRFGAARSSEWVRGAVNRALAPGDVGLLVLPVRAAGMTAGREGVDFGQLFLGLSFFIIASALLLTGLFYSLGLLERRAQIALLHATGFTRAVIARLFIGEAFAVALLGSLIGSVLALGYSRLMLWGLSTLWDDAVGSVTLVASPAPMSLATGCVASIVCALLTVWLVLRRMARVGARSAHRLGTGLTASRTWPYGVCSAVLVLAGAALALIAEPGRGREAAGVFFGAGSLLLAGLLLGCRAVFGMWLSGAVRGRGEALSLSALGGRSTARNSARSVTVVAALAASIFLVVAVGANRHGTLHGSERRSSGTGGFVFYGETSLPVPYDLNGEVGREWAGLSDSVYAGTAFVHFLVSAGDDASCLNLNRTSRPRVLGVQPEGLGKRGAFTFVSSDPEVAQEGSWDLLNADLPDGAIPAVADQSVLVWALGRNVGETLTVEDETGAPRTLRFVGGLSNSVLQGNVLVSESHFRELFPSVSGSRVFLVDCPEERASSLAEALRRGLRDRGLELERSTARLAAFNAVENTYLAIFMSLGGLGIVLGSVGLGVVVLRNISEREGELALLRAVGYGRARIVMLLVREHAVLIVLGVLGGAAAGCVSVLPAVSTPGSHGGYGAVVLWVAAIGGSAFLWVVLGALAGLRGVPVEALHRE